MKKKYSKSLKFLIPSFLILGSSAILSSAILSSCVDNKKTDITINNQTSDNQELNTNDENGLTLSVEAVSTQGGSLSYQWFVNKNATNWELIEGATYPTYNVSMEDIKDVSTVTTWKYKAEIYKDDDKTIKTESKVINVNIKPTENSPSEEETTPDEPEETPPTTPDEDTNKPGTDSNPPTNPEAPEKPVEPSPVPPAPEEPPITENPETPPNTEAPEKPNSDVIDNNSIQLKNSAITLPSQYLTNLTDTKINESLLTTNFDTDKITGVSYTMDSFNDKDGTLSLTMNYISNSKPSTHKFEFKNLMKLDENINYQLNFVGIKDNKLISALDLVEKSKSVDEFKNLLSEWEQLGVKSRIKANNTYIPINYLDFGSEPSITGFNNNWFIKNKLVTLGLTLKNAKIKYYYKENANSSISTNTFNSSRLNEKINIQLSSAVDYLQYKVTSNESYKEDKTAEEYYNEINKKGTSVIETKLVNGQWLSNVINQLTYNGMTYNYKVVVGHKTGIFLNKDKKLCVPIAVKYENTSSTTPVLSTKYRNIEIKSLK